MTLTRINPAVKRDPKIVDLALKNIDRERERLKKEYDRAMAKLDSDERCLLGMKSE